MDDVRNDSASPDQPDNASECLRAIEVNTVTLSQLIGEVRELRGKVDSIASPPASQIAAERSPDADLGLGERFAELERRTAELEIRERELGEREQEVACRAEADWGNQGEDPSSQQAAWAEREEALAARLDQMHRDMETVQQELAEAQEQNRDLAAKLAQSSVRESVGAEAEQSGAAMTWDERKQLILRQMESESFSAESFVSGLAEGTKASVGVDEAADPVHLVEQMHQDLVQRRAEVEKRDREIEELRTALEQQSAARDGGITLGAAGIAQMLDNDDLVREEREKLQQLQQEWEAKFREAEVAASLERAKLSRERQKVVHREQELQEQLETVRRISRQMESDGQMPSRRWLAELGIDDLDG